MTLPFQQPKFALKDKVDFVIVGSGAAGGVLAKELSSQGFKVVVLEQGPFLTEKDFGHDEYRAEYAPQNPKPVAHRGYSLNPSRGSS